MDDTDPKKLRRNDHPDTSHESAKRCQSKRFELLALDIHIAAGAEKGLILDELRDAFVERAPENTQFANRRKGIHDKGLVLRDGRKRRGVSGLEQHVYVATALLPPGGVQWIKDNVKPSLNPCLFEEETA